MAPYQLFKLELVSAVGLSKDAFHILLGFGIFLILLFLSKSKNPSWKLIIPSLIFGIILEILDFRDAINYGFKPDLIDSLKDIIKTISCPTLVIATLYLRQKYSRETTIT